MLFCRRGLGGEMGWESTVISGLWGGFNLLAFPFSCGDSQYVRNTQHFHAPASPRPTVSLTPGRDVFLRKWPAIWSERPHICPANEKAGLLPNPLPKHCLYPHRSRPPSSWSNNNAAHSYTWQHVRPKYWKEKNNKLNTTAQRRQVYPHTCAPKIQLTRVQRCSGLVTIRQQSFIYVINDWAPDPHTITA